MKIHRLVAGVVAVVALLTGVVAPVSPAGASGGADATAADGCWSVVSMPDFINQDIGDTLAAPGWQDGHPSSTSTAWEEVLGFALDAVAAEEPDFVLVAGDTVGGHWHRDDDGLEMFGPTATRAQKAGAIRAAAGVYYPQWLSRFADRGLTVHAALGDHELGDNPWSAGSDKNALVGVFKDAWAEHFIRPGGAYRYAQRPEGTIYEDTAYAVQHRDMLVVSVDLFYHRDGLRVGMTGAQLRWLDDVLAAGRADPSIRHIVVQGHTPVLTPVRTSGSSALAVPGGPDSGFWRTLVRHHVDLYLAGEVHAMTAIHRDGVEQITHGGLLGYGGWINYLVMRVCPDRLELQLKQADTSRSKDNPARLWQAGHRRPFEDISIDVANGFVDAGRLTVTKSVEGSTWGDRSGFFLPYVPERQHTLGTAGLGVVKAGTAGWITASVTADGTPVAGRRLALQRQRRDRRGWWTVTTVVTGADGQAQAPLRTGRTTTLRWLSNATSARDERLVGEPIELKVRVALTRPTPSARKLRHGSWVTFTGRARPAGMVRRVRLQRLGHSGWRTTTTGQVNARGTYRLTGRVWGRHFSRWRVVAAAHRPQLPGTSLIAHVRVH